jgi:hypothetical protein
MLNAKIQDELSMTKTRVNGEYYKGRIDAFQFVLSFLEDYPFTALGVDKEEFLAEANKLFTL